MSQTRESPVVLQHRKNHLPHDIVVNKILTWVPVKSVIRFRCVSKSWDSSITNPCFISTHLNNFNNNKDDDDDHRYLIHMPASRPLYNKPVCTVAFDRTFDRISEFQIPIDNIKGVEIVGSCNGLLCLAGFDHHIYLWNPSIRKFKILPVSCLENLFCSTLGFAYHSEKNDYKVVRISSFPRDIEVYSLSSDSWRRIGTEFTAKGLSPFRYSLSLFPFVSGALHWMGNTFEGEDNRRGHVIISFDVNSDKFRKLSLPCGSVIVDGYFTGLASFKGKLALITSGPSEHSIWVMREYGVDDSWYKILVLPYEKLCNYGAFTECGSLLDFRSDGLFQLKFLLIDVETLQEKEDPDIQYPSYVASFMESLVLLDGANLVSY